jgi:hypothetical protein
VVSGLGDTFLLGDEVEEECTGFFRSEFVPWPGAMGFLEVSGLCRLAGRIFFG